MIPWQVWVLVLGGAGNLPKEKPTKLIEPVVLGSCMNTWHNRCMYFF